MIHKMNAVIKIYSQTQMLAYIWPIGHSFLTPGPKGEAQDNGDSFYLPETTFKSTQMLDLAKS